MLRTQTLLLTVWLSAATATVGQAADKLQIATPGGGISAAFSAIASELGYFKALNIDVAIIDAGGGNNATHRSRSRRGKLSS